MCVCVCVYTGVYLIFTTGEKIWTTAGHIDPQTVYEYVFTPENSRQNDFYRW